MKKSACTIQGNAGLCPPQGAVSNHTGHAAEYCISSHGSYRGVQLFITRVMRRSAVFHHMGHAAKIPADSDSNPRGSSLSSLFFPISPEYKLQRNRSHSSGTRSGADYIIPGAPAGMGGMGSLMLATAASVVRKLEATLVAF